MSLLELERVVKRFDDAEEEVRAVDGVSLSVGAGQVLALYGPSGSGKSTLLLLAAGLLQPDSGTVRFTGDDLAQLDAAELAAVQRRRIGFIYQSPHLMAGVPAVENAAVKLLADGTALRKARPAASDWLERVGLSHRLDHTPERLSGGERQRVAIARALANGPRLILADEPTGNLDSRRGRQVLELIGAIAREQRAGVLLATHDPQAAEIADVVLTLRDGALLDDRTGAEASSSLPPSVEPPRRLG